jgi:hydroxyethylthiazole kinase-like uncharacterized protein yjeF
MLKILSTKQVREADRRTMEFEPIASVDLMERAAVKCTDWFVQTYPSSRPVLVFAGIGNNGGDALVMARKLLEKGYRVQAFVVRYSENFSSDLQINLDRLIKAGHEVQYILEEAQIPEISSDTVIIDGLFGSGLNRKVEGLAAICIDFINASIAEVVSIDLPSGMSADKVTPKGSPVVTASYTLTFQVPKLAFFVRENKEVIGTWQVIDIGLDPKYLHDVECSLYYVDHVKDPGSVFQRDTFDHKGIFGHGLLLAGSYGMIGAAILSGRAAMRSGIGKLTLHVPNLAYNMVQLGVPEAICSVDTFDECIGELPELTRFQAIGCGPGIGKHKKTKRLLKTLLQVWKGPLVLDADALNLIAEQKDLLKELPGNTILTPHIGEFERLFGVAKHSFERLDTMRNAAMKYKVIIVLKGAYTAIAAPNGKVYINGSGNPGMATAGSGDVLTGIITSYLAQGADPLVAAVCGVHVHGHAGDQAAKKQGWQGLIASDLIEQLGPAMMDNFNL